MTLINDTPLSEKSLLSQAMQSLLRLHADAVCRSEREGSDRGNNPGRASREAQDRAHAYGEKMQIEASIQFAKELDKAGVAWTNKGSQIFLVLPSGETYPASKGNALEKQIEIIHCADQESEFSVLEQLMLNDLITTSERDFSWILSRMDGASRPKFRSSFLTNNGILTDGALTELGRSCAMFKQYEGYYGTYQTASPLGVAWIYSCYLSGKIPLMKSHRKMGPKRNVELQAILSSVDISQLPARLI